LNIASAFCCKLAKLTVALFIHLAECVFRVLGLEKMRRFPKPDPATLSG
jgi:hypothetical protein